MPLFKEDIGDNTNLQGTPTPQQPYTGPVQSPVIPSYFSQGEGGTSKSEDLKDSDVGNIIKQFETNTISPSTPQDVVSTSTLKANDRYKQYRPNTNFEDVYAQNQSGWDRTGNAFANFVGKTAGYIIQNIGFIGGLPFAAGGAAINAADKAGGGEGKIIEHGNAVSLMTDNFVTQIADSWKDILQTQFPIYKGDQYSKGNIWDKLGTTSWWLDDAVDRLALTAAMLIPGFAEAKGLGMFGTIARGTEVEATGFVAKAIKTMADTPEVYGRFGKALSNAVYKYGATGVVDIGTNVDMATNAALNFKKAMAMAQRVELTTFNVVGQNALNGRETQTSIVKSLKEQREQGLNSYTDQQIADLGAKGSLEAFWYNMPLTLLSSMWELPQVYASMRGGMNVLKKITKPNTFDELIEGINNIVGQTVKPNTLKSIGTILFTGFEHGQLESSQVAIGRYIEDAIAGKMVHGKPVIDTDNPFVGSFKEYLNNFSDPNGQNNIALGTIQGMLTSVFGIAYKGFTGAYKQESETKDTFLKSLNNSISQWRFFNGLSDMAMKDETGNVIVNNGKIKMDQDKLAQLGTSYLSHIKNYEDRLRALSELDQIKIDQMGFDSLKSLANDFFQDAHGKEYLLNVLKFEAKNQQDNPDRADDVVNGNIRTPAAKLQESIQYVEDLYKIYNAIDQRHAGFLNLDVDYKNKEELNSAKEFTFKHKVLQYNSGADQLFFKNKIIENTNALLELGSPTEKIEDKNIHGPDDQRINDLLDQKVTLNNALVKSRDLYADSINRDVINKAWEEQKIELTEIKKRNEELKAKTNEPASQAPLKKETIQIRTARGPKTLTVGEEYLLGSPVDFEKNGLDDYIIGSYLTILGKGDEKNTIKIIDTKGVTRDISESELEKYNIAGRENLKNNVDATFYDANKNTVFSYKFGKEKGGTRMGRLQYKDGKLYFKYRNEQGKIVEKQVFRSMFQVGEKFNRPLIEEEKEIGILTPKEKLAKEKANAEFKSKKALQEEADRLVKSRDERLRIVGEIKQNAQESLKKVTEALDKRAKDIVAIQEDLAKYQQLKEKGKVRVKGSFVNIVTTSIKTLNKLTKAQKDTQDEIDELTKEQKDLELDISYFKSFEENVENLPESVGEFMKELKEQTQWTKDILDNIEKSITRAKDIGDSIVKALQATVKLLQDAIEKHNLQYPDEIRSILNSIVENEDFINNLPQLKDYLNTYIMLGEIEEAKKQIEIGEDNLKAFNDTLKELEEYYHEAEQTYKQRKTILDRFQGIWDEYLRKKAQEAALRKMEETVWKPFLGTTKSGTGIQNVHPTPPDKRFETGDRKKTEIIPISTIPVTEKKPHQVRADLFGINLEKLPTELRKNIRGIHITSENEHLIGLDGLTDHLRMTDNDEIDTTINKERIISMVIVRLTGDKENPYMLIDEKGKDIDDKKNVLNRAVYQIYGLGEFQWAQKYGGGSMFRKDTSDATKAYIIAEYERWREETLTNAKQGIDPSFTIGESLGHPEYTRDSEGNINYNARTAITDANLVTDNDINTSDLIEIPKTDALTSDTQVIEDSYGKTFLRVPNGYYELENRRHTEEEAETIYQALYQIAREMIDNGYKNNIKIERIVHWLKSVVYWGKPFTKEGVEKEAGYNSVFWEKNQEGKYILVLSGKGKEFIYTPMDMEKNKGLIIDMLRGMFKNTNSSMIKEGGSYEEITGIDKEGNITANVWKSYKHYLLSNKFVSANEDDVRNNEKRKTEDIPLTTLMRPMLHEDDANRTGFYFYRKENTERFNPPKLNPKITSPIIPVGAEKVVAEKKGYNLEGKPNKFAFNGENFLFSIKDPNLPADIGNIAIVTNEKGDIEEVKASLTRLATKLGVSYDDAVKTLKQQIYNDIKKPAVVEQEGFTWEKGESPSIDTNLQVQGDLSKLTAEERERAEDLLNFLRGGGEARRMVAPATEIENWKEVKDFLQKSFPNVPVYRLQNIIRTIGGKVNWGIFANGAIYIYEKAETGTAYHEVFEAVWKTMTPPEEQQSIIDEFRNRKGSFKDRVTGIEYNYNNKDLTPEIIKEQIAEEFRDYVLHGTLPPKPDKGRPYILKLFIDLVNLIKTFFTGKTAQSNTEKLFQKIGEGYYAKNFPYRSELSFARKGIIDISGILEYDENRADVEAREVTDRERSDTVEHMIWFTLNKLIQEDRNIFNIIHLDRKELYPILKEEVLNTIEAQKSDLQKFADTGKASQNIVDISKSIVDKTKEHIDTDWDDIIQYYEQVLRAYNVRFDENDKAQLTNPDKKDGHSDYIDATKIDTFRRASVAVKLLLSTMPRMQTDRTGKVVQLRSSIGGVKLLPVSQTFINVMNNLHSARDIGKMMEMLREMAVKDINYRSLYSRISGLDWVGEGEKINFGSIKTTYGLRVFTSFWRTFKKQSPSVKTVTIFNDNEISIGAANLSTAAQQLREEYENAIISKAKNGQGFFKYDAEKKAFVGDKDKIVKIELKGDKDNISHFLSELGINFSVTDMNKLTDLEFRKFAEAVAGLRTSIATVDEIATISGKVLKTRNRLFEIGLYKALVAHPDLDSTFFNLNGDSVQTYIGPNAISQFCETIRQIENLDKDSLEGTQYSYLLTDSFAQNSNLLERIFSNGKKIDEGRDLLDVGCVEGLDNRKNGKSKESNVLSFPERIIQAINMNLEGWYSNLVPGEATLEWIIKLGNAISYNEMSRGMDRIHSIFKGYFTSELELVMEDRPMPKDNDGNTVKGRNAKDMRFFKHILKDELHDIVIKEREQENGDSDAVYNNHKQEIDKAVDKYIEEQVLKMRELLNRTGLLIKDAETEKYNVDNTSLPAEMSEDQLMIHLKTLESNYIINHIELHKLIYADPYQYVDELKRSKLFNSPVQSLLYGSPEMNAALDVAWNKGYERGDIAYVDFNRDYLRTVTLRDIIGISSLEGYKPFERTDGAAVMRMNAWKNYKIRAEDWTDDNERQFRYDFAWEKQNKIEALKKILKGKDLYNEIKRIGLNLTKEEQIILERGNPKVKSTYTAIKPRTTGNKVNGRMYNDIVQDKYSIHVLSYRLIHDINENGGRLNSDAISLYDKMQNEDIDYAVFKSGRKTGAEELNDSYEDGKFSNVPYKGIVNVPFSAIAEQSEVPSKEDNYVTRGTQMTKQVTMDFLEAGVPIDFELKGENGETINKISERYKAWNKMSPEEREKISPLYKEIKNNQSLLDHLTFEGKSRLFKLLGIEERYNEEKKKNEYFVKDFSKVTKALRNEILSRPVDDNVMVALARFEEGDAILEDTPAYQQVRNVIYSIVDNHIASPKMPGRLSVQLPSEFMSDNGIHLTEINGKKGYVSDILKFYSEERDINGKKVKVNVCQFMVSRWFGGKMNDVEALEYLNKTEEGQRILRGLAYRIPTQKQNSTDVFEISQFLPEEFGDNVIIPAELLEKAGSDFDIDKLSLYLKNVYLDSDGKPHLVPFFGYDEKAKKKIGEMYDRGEFLTEEQRKDLDNYVKYAFTEEGVKDATAENKLLKAIFGKELVDEEFTKDFMSTFSKGIREGMIERIYKQSLENAYIESCENLITHPLNFDRLIHPNSSKTLEDIANEVQIGLYGKSPDLMDVSNLLDREFMTKSRHDFIMSKRSLAIAAKNQSNHSLYQRQLMYIDKDKLPMCSKEDRFWLDDCEIRFDDFNRIEMDGKMIPALSLVKNVKGQDISDINSQFIDLAADVIKKGAKLVQLGATPQTIPTLLFLNKLGVAPKDIVFFRNQPIIRDYLQSIEHDGYTWLFMRDYVDDMMDKYEISKPLSEREFKEQHRKFIIPSTEELKSLMNVDVSKMTDKQKQEQQFMLVEFLKYAKMAQHDYLISQGIDYDTANFNDPYLLDRKDYQRQKARISIINSVDSLLENSFLGELINAENETRDGVSNFIKSDQPTVREVVRNTLSFFMESSEGDFLKISRKVVNDLFDWAVQTNQGLNKEITDLMVKDGGAAKEIMSFVNSVKDNLAHPLNRNRVIELINIKPSPRPGDSVTNLTIKGENNKPYTRNDIIYAFRELRNYLNTHTEYEGLYDKLVKLAILQSGLSQSTMSFTSLIPYEDFERIYNKTLSKLEYIPNLDVFNKLGVFQRNNYANDYIVPRRKAKWIKVGRDKTRWNYNPSMSYLPEAVQQAIQKGDIPPILTQSLYNREANSDFMVYIWEKGLDLLSPAELDRVTYNERLDGKKAYDLLKAKKAEMRKKGDWSYIQRALFQKVYDKDNALLYVVDNKKKGRRDEYYVYKAINTWGDSNRLNELYDVARKSVVENGYMKVDEVADDAIVPLFSEIESKKNTAPINSTPLLNTEQKSINIYAGTNENDELSSKEVGAPIEFEKTEQNNNSEVEDVINQKEQESKKCNS